MRLDVPVLLALSCLICCFHLSVAPPVSKFNFDWKWYLSQHPELITQNKTTEQAARKHFLRIGHSEGYPGAPRIGGEACNSTCIATDEIRSQQYFIAALLYNNEKVLQWWLNELPKLLDLLGDSSGKNIFVSIHGSGQDATSTLLGELSVYLRSKSIAHDIQNNNEWDQIHSTRRIEKLALLRNIALRGLFNSTISFDRVVFLNDVYFCACEVLQLVSFSASSDADITCAMDYALSTHFPNDLVFYDTWVATDTTGHKFSNLHPFLKHKRSQAKYDADEPFQVLACWNGIVAIKADVFQALGYRFRESVPNVECPVCEAELMCRDLVSIGRSRIAVVPSCNVAYHLEDFNLAHIRSSSSHNRIDSAASFKWSTKVSPHFSCCPIRPDNKVVPSDCFIEKQWRLVYDLIPSPFKSNIDSIIEQSLMHFKTLSDLYSHLRASYPCGPNGPNGRNGSSASVRLRRLKPDSSLTELPYHSLSSMIRWTHKYPCGNYFDYLNNSDVLMWSSDWHIGSVADIKATLTTMNTYFIDECVGNQCSLTSTCATEQKVYQSPQETITQSPCRNKLIEKFYNKYKDNDEFKRVDVVLLTYSLGLAELYMPFNKSIAVVAHTRYEVGRHTAEEWTLFNDNLRRIASSPYNLVAANNFYDLEYIKYFTGIDVVLLPSLCSYVKAKYKPTRRDFLVAPYRNFNEELFGEIQSLGTPLGLQFSSQPALYPRYKFSDLARHPAVVFIPYQVSIMAIFEYYRMSVPLFFPNISLLYQWHQQYRILNERTWYDGAGSWFGFDYNTRLRISPVSRHPQSASLIRDLDPNNDFDRDAIMAWIRLSDFYIWPHIVIFNSLDHLMELLQTTDLRAVSAGMKEYGREMASSSIRKWKVFLDKVRRGRSTRIANLPSNVNDALHHSYGIKLNLEDDKCYGIL